MRSRLLGLVGPTFGAALLLLTAAAPEAEAQDLDRTRFLRWAHEDAAALLQDVSMGTPLLVVTGAAVLIPSSRLDDPVLEGIQEGYHGPLASYLQVSNEVGGTKALPAVTAIFAVSLAAGKPKFQDAAFTSLQSLVFAGVMTRGLKMAFGRYRPESGNGAFRFDSFSGNTSFPSGHTAAAFAVITPWVLYYPNAATYGLFALSTGTAVARIAMDKHWPTDVLAGAAIGFLTARYLARRHQLDNPETPRLNVAPAMTGTGAGVTLRFRLNHAAESH